MDSMLRILAAIGIAALLGQDVSSAEIRGSYLEARTCQVFTGPCFANGEVGLTGKHAVMCWKINSGEHDGIQLSGLGVAMAVKASHTLGFGGLQDAKSLQGIVYVDDRATSRQRRALIEFASLHAGTVHLDVVDVRSAPIRLELNFDELTGDLQVGNMVHLQTRKARADDCICSNESAYYPPLVKLVGSVPGVTIRGDVSARALGSRWSIPDSRTAYLGRFQYQ